MLGYERLRVESGEIEICDLRPNLVADVVTDAGGHAAHLAQSPTEIPGQLGQAVGPEDEDGHKRQQQDLAAAHIAKDHSALRPSS